MAAPPFSASTTSTTSPSAANGGCLSGCPSSLQFRSCRRLTRIGASIIVRPKRNQVSRRREMLSLGSRSVQLAPFLSRARRDRGALQPSVSAKLTQYARDVTRSSTNASGQPRVRHPDGSRTARHSKNSRYPGWCSGHGRRSMRRKLFVENRVITHATLSSRAGKTRDGSDLVPVRALVARP